MTITERIEKKISHHLQPLAFTLEDESAKHHGHAGAMPGGETHFRLTVISEKFEGLSAVNRQRLVYDLLKEEMTERIHALSLSLKTPAESPANVDSAS